jgi:hypothetical protein
LSARQASSWGDGDSSPGTVVANQGGGFSVQGAYTYQLYGSYTTNVQITGPAGASVNAVSTATVAQAPLVGSAATFSATVGTAYTGTVATFTKGVDDPVSNFTATIVWGDGATTAGTIALVNGVFAVSGNHAYSAVGTDAVTVTVTDTANGSATVHSTAHVSDMASTGTTTLTAIAGSSLTGTVATFTDTNSSLTASSFSASIAWGDGTTSTGSISLSAGTFSISGTHVYTAYGTYATTVTITGPSSETSVATGSVQVADAAITAHYLNFAATAGVPFSGEVATFTDANSYITASSFNAIITWAPGVYTAATVTADPHVSGQFDVSGSYIFPTNGSVTVTVLIADVAGTAVSVNDTATISAASLNVSAIAFTAAAGATFSGEVATFSQPPDVTPGDYTVTIAWGDGTSSSGTIEPPVSGSQTLWVSGTHSYANTGTDSFTVTITNSSGTSVSANGTATVSNISSAGQPLSPTEGQSFTGTVAIFSDSNPAVTLGNLSATINWGDGTTSRATIQTDPGGNGYDVVGTHTYANYGTYKVTSAISDGLGGTANTSATATVSDAALTATAATVNPIAGASFTGTVATFTDADPNGAMGDYTATIDWGDGITTTATIVADPNVAGEFDVNGTHIYQAVGTYSLNVQIADVGGSTVTASSEADVADATILPTQVTVAPVEGTQFTGVVATFTDPNRYLTAASFTATIDWGDGDQSSSTIAGGANGTYTVSGTETYPEYGTYPIQVTISDTGGGSATDNSVANVADAPLTAASPPIVSATQGADYNGTVVSFSDENPNAEASDFTATIVWGDGTSSSGSVSDNGNGGFGVSGDHTYEIVGHETVGVTVTDAGGSTLTLTNTATVAAAPVSAQGQSVQATQGTSFSGTVAVLNDSDPEGSASELTATIDWGDGTSSTGTIVIDPTGFEQFDVTGSHTYSAPGSYPIVVTASNDGGTPTVATSTASVGSSNTVPTQLVANAASKFNTATIGSSDTNTASFDLGVGSLGLVAPVGVGNSSYPTANTATMGVGTNLAVPTNITSSSSYLTTVTGYDYTLSETVVFSYSQTVFPSSSSSGSFTQRLWLHIHDSYHQSDAVTSGTVVSLNIYDEVGDIDLTENAKGTYSVSSGTTTISASYSSSESTTVNSALHESYANSSPANGGGLMLFETGSATATYTDTGTYASTGTASAVKGITALTVNDGDIYFGYQTRSQNNGGTQTFTVNWLSGTDVDTYGENDFYDRTNTTTRVAGKFSRDLAAFTNTSAMVGVTGGGVNAIGAETINGISQDIAAQGTIAQINNNATLADYQTITQSATGILAAGEIVSVSANGTTGTAITTTAGMSTTQETFNGPFLNQNGNTSLTGLDTERDTLGDAMAFITFGTYNTGTTWGKFNMSSTGLDSQSELDSTNMVVLGGAAYEKGSYVAAGSGMMFTNGSTSGFMSLSGGGASVSTTSSDIATNTSYNSGAFTVNSTGFTTSGQETDQTTDSSYNSAFTAGSTLTYAGANASYGASLTFDNFTNWNNAEQNTSTTAVDRYSQSNLGSADNGTITSNELDWSNLNNSDTPFVVTTSLGQGGLSVDRVSSYQDLAATNETTISSVTNYSGSALQAVNSSGTISIGGAEAVSTINRSTDKYTTASKTTLPSSSSQLPAQTWSSYDSGVQSRNSNQLGYESYAMNATFANVAVTGVYLANFSSSNTGSGSVSGTSFSSSPTGGSTDTYSGTQSNQGNSTGWDGANFSPAGTSGSSSNSVAASMSSNATDRVSYSRTGAAAGVIPTPLFAVPISYVTSDTGVETDTGSNSATQSAQNQGSYDSTGAMSGSYTDKMASGGVTQTLHQGWVAARAPSAGYTDHYSYGSTDTPTTTYSDSGSFSPTGASGQTTQIQSDVSTTSTSDQGPTSYTYDKLVTNGTLGGTSSQTVSSSSSAGNTYSPGNSNVGFFLSQTNLQGSTSTGTLTTNDGAGGTETYNWSDTASSSETEVNTGTNLNGTARINLSSTLNGVMTSSAHDGSTSTSPGTANSANWTDYNSRPTSQWGNGTEVIGPTGATLSYNIYSGSSQGVISSNYATGTNSTSFQNGTTSSGGAFNYYFNQDIYSESSTQSGNRYGTPSSPSASNTYTNAYGENTVVQSTSNTYNGFSAPGVSTTTTSSGSNSVTTSYSYSDTGSSTMMGLGYRGSQSSMTGTYSSYYTYTQTTSQSCSYQSVSQIPSMSGMTSYYTTSHVYTNQNSLTGNQLETDTANGSRGSLSATQTFTLTSVYTYSYTDNQKSPSAGSGSNTASLSQTTVQSPSGLCTVTGLSSGTWSSTPPPNSGSTSTPINSTYYGSIPVVGIMNGWSLMDVMMDPSSFITISTGGQGVPGAPPTKQGEPEGSPEGLMSVLEGAVLGDFSDNDS